jgi:hypothetical protein
VARDGEVDDGKDDRPDDELTQDELAERRAAKKGSNGSASIAQRARDGEEPEEEPELFPLGTLEGDPKKTLKNLLKAGATVKTSVSLTRAAVQNPTGGLFDPEEQVQVLVSVLPGHVKVTPEHIDQGGRQVVKAWSVMQELRVVHVQPAGAMFTEEQVVEMLEAVKAPAAQIAKLLGHEGNGTEG